MAYERLNLDDGRIFTAAHLAHLEDGIEAALAGNGGSSEANKVLVTKTIAPTSAYTKAGFYRPAGTFGDNSSYACTDFIDVTDCVKLTINMYTTTPTVSPVVWFDENQEFVSGETLEAATGQVTVEYDVPAGIKYAVFSTGKNTSAVYNVVASKYEVPGSSGSTSGSGPSLAHTLYVSASGSDDNDGLTVETPIATFAKAIELLDPKGELIFLDGDYENFTIDLAAFAKISTVGSGTRLLYPKVKFNTATLVSGYSRVYSTPYTGSWKYNMWQQDVADEATLISSAEKHPLHRERTHRLGNTRIYSTTTDIVSTVTADHLGYIENTTDKYCYYIDTANGVLYFSAPSADFAAHPVVIPNSTIIKASVNRKVDISGLHFQYATLLTTGLSGLLNNVSVMYTTGAGCIRWDNTFDLILNNCEVAAGLNDGINGHTSGDITCFNCWGHDCGDDGESDHETCHIAQYGGLYEYNGNGCTPASGASGEYFNTIVRNNKPHPWVTDTGSTGFSAQGNDALIYCNGCLSIGQAIGFRATGTGTIGTFINCVSKDDTTAYNGGTKFNCITAE